MTLRSKTILPLLLGLSLLFGCGGDTPTSPSTTSSAGDSSTTTAAPTTSADVGVTQAQAGQIDASIDASVADIFDAIADAIRSALSQGAGGSAQLNIAACNPAVNQVGDNVTIAGSCSVGCDASGTATLSGTLHFTPSTSALRGQGNILYKECQSENAGAIIDGTTFVSGTGHYPGAVAGTVSGNVSVYTRGPGGGLVLVDSSYGIDRNFTVQLR